MPLTVSDFSEERQLGEGTYGNVSSMKSKNGDDTIAVKRIVTGGNVYMLSSSLREVAIQTTLAGNPNITRGLAFGASGGVCSLYMECMDGTLEGLDEASLTKQRRSIFLQILQGVQAMHSIGVAHRDLKPQNILYKKEEGGEIRVALADFGMGKVIADGGSRGQAFTASITTWPYRPPEIYAQGVYAEYGLEVDMWSTGAVFLHLLLGTPPLFMYLKSSDDEEKMFRATQSLFAAEGPRRLLARHGVTDDYLVDLIERLMCEDPKGRITAREALRHVYFGTQVCIPTRHSYAKPNGLRWMDMYAAKGVVRTNTIDIIRQLCESYGCRAKTLHEAVKYMDIHMESRNKSASPPEGLVAVCAASFVLSTMLNEVDVPELLQVVESCGGEFTVETLTLCLFDVFASSGNRLLEPTRRPFRHLSCAVKSLMGDYSVIAKPKAIFGNKIKCI